MSPLAVVKDVRSTTTTTTTSGASTSGRAKSSDSAVRARRGADANGEQEGEKEILMGVRRKKSWSRSLSGTFKSLAAPLSPVISTTSSSSSKNTNQQHKKQQSDSQAPSIEPLSVADRRTRAATIGDIPSPTRPAMGSQKPSKDKPFKARLRDHVISELGDLEVNTTDLTPMPTPAVAVGFAVPTSNSDEATSTDVHSTRGPTPTPGGIDADDEEDFDDDEMDAIPEAEKEYYALAEEDKPLSARVLYPSDNEMGEFMTPNPNVNGLNSLTQGPVLASPMPLPGSAAEFGLQLESNQVHQKSRQKGTLSFEVADKAEPDTAKTQATVATTSKSSGVRKKVPIGTRLTMTSRAGFFQDRIVSPSMMRAMAILYIGPKRNPDFTTDYYISPILTPAHLLADFPPVLMLCGEKDPFVDDTVIFGGRLREAKRAKRAELLAARSTTSAPGPSSVPMSNSNSNSHSQAGMVGLRGEDARKAREAALLYEEDEDWVEMRILEGWGHGFLQMTSGLMLGQKAVNVIDEMADWIGDAFAAQGSTAPRRASVETSQAAISQFAQSGAPQHATAATTTPFNKYSERRRPSPPRMIAPSLAPTASDIPPPRHRPTPMHASSQRASSTSTTATITNSPPPSAPTNLFSPTKSKMIKSEPPPMSSETETELERDRPLSFTVVRKNQNNTGTKRASFGSSSSGSSSYRHAPQQRQQQQQSGSPVDENPASTADLPLPSSSSLPPSSSSPHSNENDVNVPLTPVTATIGESSSFAASLGFGGPGGASLSASANFDASSKPLSPKPGNSGAGGTTLLSQGELMRRRRMEAVFGMGESEDASAFDDEAGGASAPASATSTRSPSPVAMRHSRQGYEDGHEPGRAWHTSTFSIDSIDKNANGV